MIRIPGDPILESRLIQTAEKGLRARGSKAPAAPSALRVDEACRFALLQRQFAGPGVPFLPQLVSLGRRLWEIWTRWRR